MVARVRSFNRTVTQRVGALDDQYLARDRPLGEARVLWEIGERRLRRPRLRSRLGLDSGYLSRLLRSLEAAGLVVVEPSDGRPARPHGAAHARRAGASGPCSTGAATSSPARSSSRSASAQRAGSSPRWREVERLLTAALVEIEVVDPGAPRRAALPAARTSPSSTGASTRASTPRRIRRRAATSCARRPGSSWSRRSAASRSAAARSSSTAATPAEIKRMWVADSARGLGIGRRLLTELEARAPRRTARRAIRLETNRSLTEAIALYRSAGYREVDAFNDEPYAAPLVREAARLTPAPTPSSRGSSRGMGKARRWIRVAVDGALPRRQTLLRRPALRRDHVLRVRRFLRRAGRGTATGPLRRPTQGSLPHRYGEYVWSFLRHGSLGYLDCEPRAVTARLIRGDPGDALARDRRR